MDEKLKSTLRKVILLTQQYPEFGKELKKALQIDSAASLISPDHDRIAHIEKYLGLDYYVDGKPSTIDYSFIKDVDARAKLISDNREMLRNRYGTRFHQTNFSEYCLYAQLQSEMLLNYYYIVIDNNIQNIIQHIKRFNTSAIISQETTSVSAISYNSKLFAFKYEHNFNIDTLNYVRQERNEMSHRSPINDQIEIDKYKKLLEEKHNMVLRPDGTVDWYKLNDTQKAEFSQISNTPRYRQYCYLIWRNSKPFDDVIDSISMLSNKIKDLLKQI